MSTDHQDLVVLGGLVVLAASFVVLHLALGLRVVRARGLALPWRLLVWLPPFTPVAAFVAGARLGVVLWVVLAAGYLVLRTRS